MRVISSFSRLLKLPPFFLQYIYINICVIYGSEILYHFVLEISMKNKESEFIGKMCLFDLKTMPPAKPKTPFQSDKVDGTACVST